MNFLETDFRKRRIPKRSLSFKDRRGNLTAFRLEKYPVFQRKFTRLISREKTDFQMDIKRGQYTATISPNLSDIVTQQALGLIENVKSELPAQFEAELVALFVKYEKDQEIFIQEAQSALNDLLNHSFVNKVMTSIEGTLQRGRESETEDATEISDELTNYLTSVVESTIFDASTSYLVDKDFNAMNDVLDNILDSKNIIARFKDFFESFSIRDMHVEIADLYRNKKLKEELELYLYLGEIKFNGRAYPLFFLPLDITEEISNNQIVYKLSFEKRFFINKNAIEYVYQESAPENTAAQMDQEIGDRIIYIDERETLTGVAERISNQLLSQFRLDGNIQFSNNFPSTASNSSISINNKCSIALFDKADESSINDYEELLRYLESGNPLGEMFKNIISNFINEEPVTISNNIQREWDGLSTSEQLVFSSPIPLNEEQRKIISAVNNKEGKFITVEGPPGTGKSHTITAILFEAILKNKSVLMLSDKKEALDVVEDKLTETLNKTRVGEDFQNPILRLGRAGNTYAKILQNQNVERIKMHLRASVDKLEDIKPEKQEKELKQKVETYISSYAAIHAKDIKQYLELVGQLSLSDGDENTLLANSTPINKLKTAITALQKSSKDIDEHTKELIAKQRKTPLQTISKLFLSLQIAQSNKTKTYTPVLSIFNTINRSHLKLLKPKIAEYMEVKDRFWAFLLSNLQLNDWNQSLNEKLDLKEFIDFREEKNFGKLQKYYGLLQKLEKAFIKNNIDAKSEKLIDDFLVDENVIIKPKLAKDIHEKIEEYEKVSNIEHLSKPPFSINFIKDQNLFDYDYDTDLSRVQLLKTFIDLSKKLKKHFKAVPDFNLSEEIKE